MNTELLRRILDKARDDALNPSAAMAVEDLMRDVQDIETIQLAGLEIDELPGLYADSKELREHVKTQPFDVEHDDPETGVSTVTDTGPAAFEEWLGELERLAQ